MGNTYVNFTVHGPSQQAVAGALSGRTGIVSPSRNGNVVVYDQQTEEMSDSIEELGSSLSMDLNCPVLAVSVYDDDILQYMLFDRGEKIDEYNSSPGYFAEDSEPDNPIGSAGGDAAKLCGAFGVQKSAEVERILRTGSGLSGGYTFEIFRHEALCKALGIPEFAVAAGYGYITAGELPSGLAEKDLVRVE